MNEYFTEDWRHRNSMPGYTPLILASKFGNLKIVQELVAAGAEVDMPRKNFQSTALHYALVGVHQCVPSDPHWSVVKYLLEICHASPERIYRYCGGIDKKGLQYLSKFQQQQKH